LESPRTRVVNDSSFSENNAIERLYQEVQHANDRRSKAILNKSYNGFLRVIQLNLFIVINTY
jgi:hypothetical protein